MLKPLHALWLTNLNNLMRSTEGKNIVLKSSDITDIIQKGVSNLPELNSFSDINPMINLDTVEPYLEAMIDNTAEDLEMLGVK